MISVIKAVDKYVGSTLCTLFGGLSKLAPKKKLQAPSKILIIQLWGIGETILTLPAIHALAKKYPKSTIEILCTARNSAVYFNQGFSVREISLNPFSIKWFISTHFKHYDLVIDMEEYLNNSALISYFVGKYRIGYDHGVRALLYNSSVSYNDEQHCAQTFMDLLQPLGITRKVQKLIPVQYTTTDEKNVKKLLSSHKNKLIGISPGAAESSKMRMWPEDKWAKLIDKISENYKVSFVMVGASDVYDLNERIISKLAKKDNVCNLAGKTSVRELFALSSLLSLMISIDSGPMHITAAQSTPTIGLFGPNTPVRFGPFGPKNISIYKPVGKPIINVHKGEVPISDDPKWMSKITVKDVYDAVKKLI